MSTPAPHRQSQEPKSLKLATVLQNVRSTPIALLGGGTGSQEDGALLSWMLWGGMQAKVGCQGVEALLLLGVLSM